MAKVYQDFTDASIGMLMRWIGLSFAAAFDRWVAHAKGKGRQPAHTRSLKAAFGYLTGKNGKVSPQRLAEVLRGVMAQVAIPCRGDEDAAILAVQRAVEGMIMDQHLNTIHEPHAVFDDLVKSVDHGPSPHQEFDDLVATVSHGPAANAPVGSGGASHVEMFDDLVASVDHGTTAREVIVCMASHNSIKHAL